MVQKDKMIEEATKRLETLQNMGLWDEVVRIWKENGEACVSTSVAGMGEAGINFAFSEKPELKEIKDNFEKEFDCVVYYGILSETFFGRCLSLFYVSNTKSNWSSEKSETKKGYASVYVWNMDLKFGEFGSIQFDVIQGGLFRTN